MIVSNSVLAIAVAPALMAALAPAPAEAADELDTLPEHWWVYIGTYTGGASEGIYLLRLDAASGQLELAGLAGEAVNPSFLALHPAKPLLYSVGEMDAPAGGPGGSVNAYAIDPASAALELLNQQPSIGAGPCHVAVHPEGGFLAVANYGGGSAAVFPIREDGRLEPASGFAQHDGASVNPQRQQGPHAHSVNYDAAGRYLFVADLGTDKIMVYRHDPAEGAMPPNDPPYAGTAPGAGPRHFVFHPSGRWAYVINEMGNTITAFAYDPERGRLEAIHSVNTLPPDFEGENTTAEIRVHPSGRFVYGSNRGHDSIAVFRVDEETGRLTPAGHSSTQGRTPRNFNIDPAGRFLVAANQSTHNIVVFRIDTETGALEPVGAPVEVPSPVCVIFRPPFD